MNNTIKYVGYGVLILIVFILSVDVKSLSEVRAAEPDENEFDAAQYAENFWTNELSGSLEETIELSDLLNQLETNFEQTAETGQKVGISDNRYFLIQGSGTITDLSEDQIEVKLESSNPNTIFLASGFIFGNTVRNAVPQIKIGEFMNMTQFNRVSIQINQIVEERVVSSLEEEASAGRNLDFTGALSIDVKSTNLDSIRIIPLSINFSNQ